MPDILRGAISGLLATVPMTIAMDRMYQVLPGYEKYPSPPEQVTANLERRFVGTPLPKPVHKAATIASHFGYGAVAGAFYGSISRFMPLPAALRGIVYAMIVWSISYTGWLPAMDLGPSITQEPLRRNVMMIAAHLIWGSALGILVDRL